MDISILFSVGSFVVSERVLKPKASLLAILGCVLCYDLTTKTNDSSSLRVYRGPALLGFTLMMCAYSLRTWRRNGVACDELIFLPGTVHGQRHGVMLDTATATATATTSGGGGGATATTGGEAAAAATTTANYAFRRSKSSPAKTTTNGRQLLLSATTEQSALSSTSSAANSCEGDVAAGVAPRIKKSSSSASPSSPPLSPAGRSSRTAPSSLEMTALDDLANNDISNNRNRTVSRAESSIDSIQAFSDSWDDDEEMGDVDMSSKDDIDDERAPLTANNTSTTRVTASTAAIPTPSLQLRTAIAGAAANSFGTSPRTGGIGSSSSSTSSSSGNAAQDAVQRFSENHPRITFIGSFFFFRSSVSSESSATYAPSGPMVIGGALDLCMPTLFNFHLFTEAYHHIDEYGSDLPAKILPIIFLTILLGRCMFPPGKRARFWGTLKYTFMAPFHASRFRDVFIGDVLTSFVRPGQDILFALSYYITVMRGMITGEYGLSDSGAILESSWLLHNVVLPSVALLPLWWRFLQTLRQAYDSSARWPHLGNAFKYLSASLVILYGMTHPEDRRSSWWIVSFGLCLLYQLWWDVVMDWDLLVIVPREDAVTDHPRRERECNSFLSFPTTSSYQGDSYILPLRMLFWQPIKDMTRFLCNKIPKISQIQLRKRRLYKTESFYWRILAYNVVFRFAWMLCYIPAYRLSASGVEHVTTFSSDTNSYVGVLLPVAELLRRTFWGFLLLEKETIRMQDEDPTYSRIITSSASSSGGLDGNSSHRENSEARRDSDVIILGDDSSASVGGAGTGGVGGGTGAAAIVASKNEASGDVEMGSDSENGRKLRYIPAWLASTLQHHEDAATAMSTSSSSPAIFPSRCRCPSTLSSSSSSCSWLCNIQSKIAEFLDLTDHTRQQLFTAELTVWAIAFIMLGLWATT